MAGGFTVGAGQNEAMTPLGVWLTITIVITVGLLLGVVLSWIDQPRWASPRRLAIILIFVAAADVGITYMQQAAPVAVNASDQDVSAAASAAGLVSVGKIDAAQASRAILSITGVNSGHSRLVESSLNGAAHSTMTVGPPGAPFAVTGSHQLVAEVAGDAKPNAGGLGVTSLLGTTLRVLTSPPADTTDTDPAVTADGEVYFIRTITAWNGQNGTPTEIGIMKVPISQKSPPARVPTSVPISFSAGPLSVNAAGTLLASICQPSQSSATEGCVFALPSGRVRYMTHFDTSSPVTDVAISPDGKYLAFGDAASNPYGTIQIYVKDLATGSTVMVSHLPGDSRQPSWIPNSAAPCLLFSNSQTFGDVIYLSCVSAYRGTARVTVGDYPEWLGTTLAAARSSPEGIDWRALWNKSRPSILLAGTFVLSLLLGLFAGWFPRPAWATSPRIAGVIVALGALQVGGAVIVPHLLGQPPGGLTTITQLDPAQAGDLIVAEDSTTGTGQLFGIRLNGSNRQALQFYPAGSTFIPVGTNASSFVFNYGGGIDADIRLVGPTGNEIAELSHPPPGETDSSPALAPASGEVYFVRSRVVPSTPSSSTTVDPVVMRVSLRGGFPRRVLLQSRIGSGPISVNAAATELAAACPGAHYAQVCVYNLPEGRLRYIVSAPTGLMGIALSPDGKFLAYGTGTILYVHSFETSETVTIGSLPGWNEQPDWLQGGSNPCLLFANLQTAANTIYLACLAPRPAWAPVTQGEYPAWLGP
jgi:WD40 repeat protein